MVEVDHVKAEYDLYIWCPLVRMIVMVVVVEVVAVAVELTEAEKEV